MLHRSHFKGIVRARSAAVRTLADAISSLHKTYTEHDLAERWLQFIRNDNTVFPFGWYQPPPNGISVLIGTPPHYERLKYRSLRDPENFPSLQNVYTPDSIIYPYFSAIDKMTMMIGDHVGTYYSGSDTTIREWIRQAYYTTKGIVSHVRPGMQFSELYDRAASIIKTIGAQNNTFSISGGLAADIGHTIPFFGEKLPNQITNTSKNPDNIEIAKTLSSERKFVSKSNTDIIKNFCAFTIEPQLINSSMPMASFHFIVTIIDGEVKIVEEFRNIFDLFGMNTWIDMKNIPRPPTASRFIPT